MQPTIEEWLKTIPPEKGHYFAGFTDGEGSFNVSIRKRPDHQIGWQTELCFNVSQKEEYILAQFKKLLGCGRLQSRKDGVYYYVVVNPRSITERVIPFFERFTFCSQKKQRNFMIFKQIAQLVTNKRHLERDGLQQIMELREKLNEGKGRTRKYALQDYEQFCQENPQRLIR
ncbi:MAG: LAGLIDADG family homing endonuclease [Candidatus Kerfeldbacteria bacterium]|nr:LAGLIDADG family homing endonuclease [Candidatus Kerfeldbacteria bacterium]